MNYFLGIQVIHTTDGFHLNQTKYVIDLFCKAKMVYLKDLKTTMTNGERLSNYGSDTVENAQLYKSIIGALQYATITRPELAYSVNHVCQFMQNPLKAHWKVVKRILRYFTVILDLIFTLLSLIIFSSQDFCDTNRPQTRMTEGLL